MNSILQRIQIAFSDAGANAYERMTNILPETVLAIGVVLLGWVIASLMYFLCVRVLKIFAVDKLAAKTPLDRMMKSFGIQKDVSEILGLLIFWMAVLVTLIFASEILHLRQVSIALGVVTRYIPQVIAALLIVVFGMLLARFLQMLSVQAVSKSGLGYEKSVGKFVNILVLVFVFLAASEQLGFDLSFVTTNVLVILSVILLVLGFAAVLGSRSVLEGSVACWQLRRQIHKGDHIEIDGCAGTIDGFTQTGVILNMGSTTTIIPAHHFFAQRYTLKRSS